MNCLLFSFISSASYKKPYAQNTLLKLNFKNFWIVWAMYIFLRWIRLLYLSFISFCAEQALIVDILSYLFCRHWERNENIFFPLRMSFFERTARGITSLFCWEFSKLKVVRVKNFLWNVLISFLNYKLFNINTFQEFFGKCIILNSRFTSRCFSKTKTFVL